VVELSAERAKNAPEYDGSVVLVALTGGIGSGKSTVAHRFGQRGAVVVDADAAARAVVEPGTPALARLVERFGAGILAPDGSLDRPALAALAFADEDSRRALEAITHPAIIEDMDRRIAAAPPDAVVVVEVQLLAETWAGNERPYDAVVVVEAPREVRLERLAAKGMSRDDAERRMAAQATDEERRAIATYAIENAGDLAGLDEQVDAVWADLRRRRVEAPE
jgi:dephospho-CoA kinase